MFTEGELANLQSKYSQAICRSSVVSVDKSRKSLLAPEKRGSFAGRSSSIFNSQLLNRIPEERPDSDRNQEEDFRSHLIELSDLKAVLYKKEEEIEREKKESFSAKAKYEVAKKELGKKLEEIENLKHNANQQDINWKQKIETLESELLGKFISEIEMWKEKYNQIASSEGGRSVSIAEQNLKKPVKEEEIRKSVTYFLLEKSNQVNL